MKSVRVATLEVSEGEGMRGSSHFTQVVDRAGGVLHTFHGCDRRLISRTRD